MRSSPEHHGGTLLLAEATPWFPARHDPCGGGRSRRRQGERISPPGSAPPQYVAPDNGLLSRSITLRPPSIGVAGERTLNLAPEVSHHVPRPRHHGAGGGGLTWDSIPRRLGPPVGHLTHSICPRPLIVEEKVRGQIISIDSFGNLITNITHDLLAGRPNDGRVCVVCGIFETYGIYRAYGEQAAGMLVALIGSTHRLEFGHRRATTPLRGWACPSARRSWWRGSDGSHRNCRELPHTL